jgi:carbon storage regulator
MLVMRRKEGEAILIGEDIQFRILSINRSTVKIGITAPREIPVKASDMEAVQRENWAAAQISAEQAARVAALLRASPTGNSPALADE